jgi:osmotically-inducible protein OsmY
VAWQSVPHVAFAGGVATLTGAVDSMAVKNDAETAIWKDEDVSRVVNQIVVAAPRMNSNKIANDARRRILSYHANSIFDSIEIEAKGNALIVRGEVTKVSGGWSSLLSRAQKRPTGAFRRYIVIRNIYGIV